MRGEQIPSQTLMEPSTATPSASSLRGASWSFEPPILVATPPAKYTVTTTADADSNPHSDIFVYFFFQDDLAFTFSFNLIVSRDGEDVKFPLKETCSPALAWAPREVTCEENYMEVTKLPNGSEQKLYFPFICLMLPNLFLL